jgi:AcrR family transcriptional regulator
MDGRQTVAAVARTLAVSEPTVRKWLKRYRGQGADGLADRPSRPTTVARRTPDHLVQKIKALHQQNCTGTQIAQATGLSPATVSRYLRKTGLKHAGGAHMPPRAGTADDGDDQRRARIMRHATSLFLSHGYERTNIEAIAHASRVGKVTIYRCFGDKAGLTKAILAKSVEGLGTVFRRIVAVDDRIENVLTAFAVQFIRVMTGKVGGRPFYEFGRLALEVSYHHPDIARYWVELQLRGIADPLRDYLQEQINQGVLAPMNADVLQSFFSESLVHGGSMILARDSASKQHLLDLAPIKVRLFLDGCRARKERSPAP